MSYNKKEHELAGKKLHLVGRRKKLFIALVVVSFVIAIGIGGYYVYDNFFAINNDSETATDGDGQIELSVSERAAKMASDGDYAGGQRLLDDELATTNTDSSSQAGAYVKKAILAVNNVQYDDAITFANKADNLSQNRMTSRLLAQIYAKMGDTAKALEYYQLTISRYSENDKISDDEAQNYYDDMQKIQELSQ